MLAGAATAPRIYLAGILAMTGYITTRQVAYDKEAHGVQLIGKDATVAVTRSSVRTKTGSFDGGPCLHLAEPDLR
jgi:hypothetical protein